MSLTHWFNSQHSDVVSAWLGANPSYRDTEENAARIFGSVSGDPTPESLDAAWKQVQQAAPLGNATDHSTYGLDQVPAWVLAQALWAKVDKCPFAGATGQIKSLLAQIFTAGGAWFIAEGRFGQSAADRDKWSNSVIQFLSQK